MSVNVTHSHCAADHIGEHSFRATRQHTSREMRVLSRIAFLSLRQLLKPSRLKQTAAAPTTPPWPPSRSSRRTSCRCDDFQWKVLCFTGHAQKIAVLEEQTSADPETEALRQATISSLLEVRFKSMTHNLLLWIYDNLCSRIGFYCRL